MSDEGTQAQTEGQPESTVQTASEPAPASTAGQSTTEAPDTTTTDKASPSEDYVYDPVTFKEKLSKLPEDVRKDVEAFHKSLQGSYTKKTQGIAETKRKLEAFDQFNRDPIGNMQKIAQQMGYRLTRAEAKEAIAEQQTGNGWTPEQGDPKSWGDVVNYARQSIMQELTGQLQPLVQTFRDIKKTSVEQQLAQIDPGWQHYEEQMMETLKEHPSLAKDPAKLYRLSVPSEVLESRAVQRALAKLEHKTESAKVSGPSTTNKKPNGISMPDKPVSFAEAVKIAQAKLAEDGIRP